MEGNFRHLIQGPTPATAWEDSGKSQKFFRQDGWCPNRDSSLKPVELQKSEELRLSQLVQSVSIINNFGNSWSKLSHGRRRGTQN